MTYPLISEYVEAVSNAEDNFDKLRNLRPVTDGNGDPVMTGGNFAVVFKMRDEKNPFDNPNYWNNAHHAPAVDDEQAEQAPFNSQRDMVYYYHKDHLGSSAFITNDSACVVQQIEYLPYGEVFLEKQRYTSDYQTPYRFNGKELDEETGLYYYGARYMNPRLGVWYGADKMEEKYANMSTYTYCLNNPINSYDNNGNEPIKPQAGTASGFVNTLNTTGTKSGLKVGVAAANSLRGFGTIDFHFPRPLPAKTGKINLYNDKYIYTTKGGWIDMAHFMFYAGVAYDLKVKKQEAQKFIREHPIRYMFMSDEARIELNKTASQSPVGEAVQLGYIQEMTDRIAAKHSAYSYEDLPSDRFGAIFGAQYFDPTSKLSLGEQLLNYLKSLGATSPMNAPNYNILPISEPTQKPSQVNHSTTPIYTK